MKLTVEIPDSKAGFRLELLHSLPFVKVQQEEKARKSARKAELITDIQESISELK